MSENILTYDCFRFNKHGNIIRVSRVMRVVNPLKTNIYLIKDNATGAYKIGQSVDPSRRLSTIKAKKPLVELLFYCEAFDFYEKMLHEFFSYKHICGEWFGLSALDIEHIKSKKWKMPNF